MVNSLVVEEFLVSFLVDARGGYMQAQRMPQMKIFVPPDAAPAPTRIICHLLRPDNVSNLPGMNDCDGFASRILQIHSSCPRFQKPILIEMPHIALLRQGDRELVIMKRSFDSDSWKEHTTTYNDDALKAEFGSLYESITPVDQLDSSRICRIIATEIPNFFALISRFQRDINMIGPEGGLIESKADKRIKLKFPQGALMKKIQIGLEVQNVDPEIVNHVTGDKHNISLSPIITVEPKRRKFRDLIEIQMAIPKGVTKADIPNLKLLFSITEYSTKWEDVTNSTELTLIDDCVVHSTKISARVWLIFAPGIEDIADFANKIYALHCPTPYVGRFLAFARRHEQEECQVRCILLTDDTSEKTLECQESFELIAIGTEIEAINKLEYQIETAGNIVAVTKSDESILFPVQAFFENRITLPIRIRNTEEPFSGKIAFIPHYKSVSKQPTKPITTLDIAVPDCIVDMVGSVRNPDRKHRVKDAPEKRIKGVETIAKTELDLKSVADAIGNDWHNLSEELGLNSDDINLVLGENCTDEEKAFMTLIQWQSSFGKKATGTELNRALRSIGREDVVKACMGDITLVEDAEERKSAIEQLNGDVKDGHEGCWDDVISTNNKQTEYNESVNESMIVEPGDDDEKLSDVSDDKSLVEATQESENEIETEIKPIVDPTRAVTDTETTSSEKISAFISLVDQLDELLPEPVIHEPERSHDYSDAKEIGAEDMCYETQMFMSCIPSDYNEEMDSEDGEYVSRGHAMPALYAEPLFSESLIEEKKGVSESESDTEARNQQQKHSVLHEVFESDPQVQTEIEEDREILPDGSIVNRKITRKLISHVITEKVTRDINSEDEEHVHAMLCLENPTEVMETEEELPDGSIIKRTITTSKSQTSTSSKFITEKEIEKVEGFVDSTADQIEELNNPIENEPTKPIVKSRKNKNRKKSNKK